MVKENVNTSVPDDIAYVSSGYAPLSVRLLQLTQKPGWAACPEIFKFLPGPTVEFTQTNVGGGGSRGGGAPLAVLQELDRVLGTACSGVGGGMGGGGGGVPAATAKGGGSATATATVGGKMLPSGKKVMLVYFIGGVSFMEIAAMRYLSRQKDFPFQIIVCTTKLINGNVFVESTIEDLQNQLRI